MNIRIHPTPSGRHHRIPPPRGRHRAPRPRYAFLITFLWLVTFVGLVLLAAIWPYT